ncbi:hypothetical protein LTR37_002470 [Vermiconidia calcicola]|uniref:Uncharacterized protein n=1 Tax=Vermiconidia calcicola TaxID=1690605 RepID=A0ACC3NSS3_9PEZI|nr:hypothetical protein LTR37_002470 [Vermiconidia calcicola]
MAASIREAAAAYSMNAASNATDAFTADVSSSSLSIVSTLLNNKLAVLFAVLVIAVVGKIVSGGQKLPEGVKPLPILPGLPWAGRFWDVPSEGIASAWHFGALHKKYGPIYAWKVMGTVHVWIETDKVARDLFTKRQRKYCDRNGLPAAVGIREGKEVLPLMGFSDVFKRYKNFMHYIMKYSAPKAFYGWPASENKKTLRRLLENPDRWSEHLIIHCARTIAGTAWGDPDHGKKLLSIVPELLKAVSPAGPIINKLTFLANLPWQLSPFKVAEARRKKEMQDAFYEALNDATERYKNGTGEECWSQLWLQSDKSDEAKALDYHEAAHAIGSSSFVAIATIGGPLHAFFLAVCQNPEWLPRLQQEIDSVCGDRLPGPEDMPNMPALRATVKEIVRWRQSTPLGVPHVAMEDDVYEGYLIPKGAICHANNYLISREPKQFPRGNEFVPERWIDSSYPTYKEPLTEFPNIRGDIAFGYGMRACPGVDLTNLELFTLFGALAWSFNISPKGAVPRYEVNPYVITMPSPFPINLSARSEEKKKFILEGCDDAGYWLKDKDAPNLTRWEKKLIHEDESAQYTWEGLTTPYQGHDQVKVYPPIEMVGQDW